MSSNPQRPDSSGRAACARLGASASCLVVTILAANQAAARDALAPLPYLAHVAPAALRFAAARPPTPPPPRPAVRPEEKAPAPENPATDPAPDPTNPAAQSPPTPMPAGAPGDEAAATVPTRPVPPSATTDPTAAPPSGLPVLPDEYARPAPVTVDQLLPYFLPPPPPVSRAAYEIK